MNADDHSDEHAQQSVDGAKSIGSEMEEWFRTSKHELRCAMTACQLEYRFKGDVFAKWWGVLREAGIKYEHQMYILPRMPDGRSLSFSANALYEYLDGFAVPTSHNCLLQDLPPPPQLSEVEESWARNLRDEIIFRKMRRAIELDFGVGTKNDAGDGDGDVTSMYISPFKEQRQNGDEAQEGEGETTALRRSTRSRRRSPRMSAGKRKSADDAFGTTTTVTDRGADLLLQSQRKLKSPAANRSKRKYDTNDGSVTFPTAKQCIALVKKYPLTEVVEHETSYRRLFAAWRFHLCTNHSLLLYGVGSKAKVLTAFATEGLRGDGDMLVLNGCDDRISMDGILDMVIKKFLGGKLPPFSHHTVHSSPTSTAKVGLLFPHRGDLATVQKAIFLAKALAVKAAQTNRVLTIVIHSMDHRNLRNLTAQESLAALVFHSAMQPSGANCIRLAASVDSINAPMSLWDPLTLASFSFIMEPVHTYRPYVDEIMHDQTVEVAQHNAQQKRRRGTGVVESILNVMKSLAPRLSEALQVLAKTQLQQQQQQQQQPDVWIQHRAFLKDCQRQAVVSGDQQLRTFLTELKDQDIVESIVRNGQLFHRIPYSTRKLEEIMAYRR